MHLKQFRWNTVPSARTRDPCRGSWQAAQVTEELEVHADEVAALVICGCEEVEECSEE